MVRVRQSLAGGVLLTAGLVLLGCGRSNTSPDAGSPSPTTAAPVVIGSPLYTAAPMPKRGDVPVSSEPIVIPNAVVQNDQRVQVSAQTDGIIDLLATPVYPNVDYDPKDYESLLKNTAEYVTHPRDDKNPKQLYRRLRENDLVRERQILGRQDEQLAFLQMKQSEILMAASEKVMDAAKRAEEATQKQLELFKNIAGAATAQLEMQNIIATAARYQENYQTAVKERARHESEYKTAEAQLARCWIISPINGRVVRLLKSPREYAKAGEPILEIQATDRVRVEGKLDVQYAELVRRGMKVIVEPARPVGPEPLANNHRLEVTGVTVTAHKGRPLVISGGMDSTVLVWDLFGSKQSHRLAHPVGVRSLAYAGGGKVKGHWLATGGIDGKVRLWNVTDPEKLPREAVAVFEDNHAGPVAAMAFSPDGRFLATASGRDAFIWDVEGKKKLYALPAEHRDALTAVHFTPQATLVTVARDRSIRIWKLGTEGASVQSVIDHRGGSVDTLGVSSDGSRVLFDKDPSRLDVVSLADEQTVATLQNPGGGNRFATLAIFSADDSLLLTVGGDAEQRGELTVWETPQPGGRAAERRRLMTPRGAPVTCAAFSPDPEKRIIAVGTSDGGVYYWPIPAADERGKRLTGEVVSVLPADARTVTVRVELPNPTDQWGEGLKDRSLATIIIDPSQPSPKPALPPPSGGLRPAGGVGPAGAVIPAGGVMPAANGPMPPVVPAGLPPVPAPPASNPPGVAPPPSAPGPAPNPKK